MNAHTLRKWSLFKNFMYLLLAICSLLVFWCQGASAMHLTPLDFSFDSEYRRQHYLPQSPATASTQNQFISLIKNSSRNINSQNDKFPSLHYQKHPLPADHHYAIEDVRLQKLWQIRMKEKRSRILAHRKQKLIIQEILEHQKGDRGHNEKQNYKPSANQNLNISNLKHLINHNLIAQHSHHASNKFNVQKNSSAHSNDRSEELYETFNELMANISQANNRNRRESRFHHQQHLQSSSSSSASVHNNNSVNRNNNRQRRRRYCSARDAKTLAFEAPTVFEGKIKSMTQDRQANFSATVEILRVYKQQTNFTLPRQVRLQFASRNASECDIYREEFRHRGFVRDELEQGKIYFLFVRQISLGNFTILGQPIKKISRTAKDVEIGVSEKYGK